MPSGFSAPPGPSGPVSVSSVRVAGNPFVKRRGKSGGGPVDPRPSRACCSTSCPYWIVPVPARTATRLFYDLGTEHIEWRKTEVLDSPEVTPVRLEAPMQPCLIDLRGVPAAYEK